MLKKSLLLVLAVVVVVSFSYSSSIIVTSPHSGDVWYKGLTYTIKWTKNGSMYSMVKIRLYRGNTKIFGITDSTPNDGSFSWKVPDTIAPGTYYIRVKTVDNKVFDNSNLVKIENTTLFNSSKKFGSSKNNSYGLKRLNILKGAKLRIKVLSPSKGDLWSERKTYKIVWDKGNINDNSFNIYLINMNNQIVKTIVLYYKTTGNTGIYQWNVPSFKNFNYNEKYRILVKTLDGRSLGKSEPFKIDMRLLTKKFRIPAKINWHWWRRKRNAPTFITYAPHEAEEVGNRAIVGYDYRYTKHAIRKNEFVGWYYRSKLYFDLSEVRKAVRINDKKIKGVVTNAVLHMSHSYGDKCAVNIYEILTDGSGDLKSGVKLDFLATGYPLNVFRLVLKWVAHPEKNKGIMLVGNDENFTFETKKCVEYFDNIYLEITTKVKD
jgi:hypothetical protein